MDWKAGEVGVRQLHEWLEADDAGSREHRAKRLRELLDVLPMPEEGLTFVGGEASVVCLAEIRRCYLQGTDLAVVFLCLAYVERELATCLFAEGWSGASNAKLTKLLDRAYEERLLSTVDRQTYHDLARVRNSYAHFRNACHRTSLLSRRVGENALGTEVIAEDAARAIRALARLVKRQSGKRLTLGPPPQG